MRQQTMREMAAACCVAAVGLGLVAAPSAAAEEAGRRPVRVFVLAGQSNMEGKAKMSLVDFQAEQPETREFFAHMRRDGKWIERDDVWIKFLDRKGPLTAGYGSRNCIGPELEFGHVVGEHYEEPVLLIKTAWGGRSLFRDFRPPSAGLPPQEELEKMLAAERTRNPNATLDEVKQAFGASYRAMLDEVRGTLSDLKTHFPQYDGRGCQLAGFVWFQGWNDMINAQHTAEYTANLAHLVRDVRRDLGVPKLPVVVGQMGVGGAEASDNVKRFKAAQAAIAQIDEFAGNLAVVPTDVYWDLEADAVFRKGWREHIDEWNKVGSDFPYHYLGSARTYCRIGRALAEAAIKLDRPAP
jgi:hypothetical protein